MSIPDGADLTDVSPASNGGCGLKHRNHRPGCHGFVVSPASNGGCGLKQQEIDMSRADQIVSPASNGGCGLKLAGVDACAPAHQFHPPVMAGVD